MNRFIVPAVACAIFALAVEPKPASPDLENVDISVYYSSFDNRSRNFLLDQVIPSYEKHKAIVELDLVPFGLTNVTVLDDNRLRYDCVHGPYECFGNKLHAVINEYFGNEYQKLAIRFIKCLLESSQWLEPLKSSTVCVQRRKLSQEWNTIVRWYESELGDEIIQTMGYKSRLLGDLLVEVPLIQIDGTVYRLPVDNLSELIRHTYVQKNKREPEKVERETGQGAGSLNLQVNEVLESEYPPTSSTEAQTRHSKLFTAGIISIKILYTSLHRR